MTDEHAPDLIGPVIAYRAWRVADRFTTDGTTGWDEGPRLGSMLKGQPWPPGVDLRAQCIFQQAGIRMPDSLDVLDAWHQAPAANCQCGFYVMHTLDDLLDEPSQVARLRHSTSPAVAGEVEVWGHAERYKRGRRVELCRVRSIYRTPLNGDVDVDALAAVYGVPVLDDPDGKIAAWRQDTAEASSGLGQIQGHPGGVVVIVSGYRTPAAHAANLAACHQKMKQAVGAMAITAADAAKLMEALRTALQPDDNDDGDGDDGGKPGMNRDPDKPIPNMRRDHLELNADHRSPRSIRKKGVRNGRPR